MQGKNHSTFDWLVDWNQIKPLVDKWSPDRQSIVLDLGCGSSILSEEMHDYGYTSMHANDISNTVIEQM
jgi:2-polyprenyl-3-methyl-5-hydroxy-6-metoxy-1,4-benzoquinol methylase